MKTKDKKFIKKIISSDFEPIANPDFTIDTLKLIEKTTDKKSVIKNTNYPIFIYPLIAFTVVFIITSVIKIFYVWFDFRLPEVILSVTEKVSKLLMQPTLISIMMSFLILYLIDAYLNKLNSKITKYTRTLSRPGLSK